MIWICSDVSLIGSGGSLLMARQVHNYNFLPIELIKLVSHFLQHTV